MCRRGFSAAERIYANEHWASDCFLGAAIGYFTADWIMDLHKKRPGESAWGDLKVLPYAESGAAGLGLALKF